MRVRNCTVCSHLFELPGGTICPECRRSPAVQQTQIWAFLQENGGHGTVEEIATATGIPKSAVVALVSSSWFHDDKGGEGI